MRENKPSSVRNMFFIDKALQHAEVVRKRNKQCFASLLQQMYFFAMMQPTIILQTNTRVKMKNEFVQNTKLM